MQGKNRIKTLASILGMTMILGACSTASDTIESLKWWGPKAPEPCSRVTVLKNASELTRFKEGPGQDLIDVLFEAEITNVFSTCQYDVDRKTRAGLIHSQVAPVIAATRGPANKEKSAELEYFVAIVDANKKILQKSVFPLKLAFPGNLTRNEVRDEPIDLELVTDGSTDGRDYEIYVGLQMSHEEMHYQERLKQR